MLAYRVRLVPLAVLLLAFATLLGCSTRSTSKRPRAGTPTDETPPGPTPAVVTASPPTTVLAPVPPTPLFVPVPLTPPTRTTVPQPPTRVSPPRTVAPVTPPTPATAEPEPPPVKAGVAEEPVLVGGKLLSEWVAQLDSAKTDAVLEALEALELAGERAKAYRERVLKLCKHPDKKISEQAQKTAGQLR